MSQHKVKLDASTNQKSHQTTFYLKADSKKELERAKKSLLALLSPIVRFPSRINLLVVSGRVRRVLGWSTVYIGNVPS